jgi:hypothetical protein
LPQELRHRQPGWNCTQFIAMAALGSRTRVQTEPGRSHFLRWAAERRR